jgi:membrane protease subunit HflK
MRYSNNQPPPEVEKILNSLRKMKGSVLAIILPLLIVVGAIGSFYTVQPDEEAVVIRFGKHLENNQPGLHFKIPFGVDKIIKVTTKIVHEEQFGFRTVSTQSKRTTYSSRNFDYESLMLTGDLNVAEVQWAVQYQISDPFKYLFQMSEPITNIRDISESIMRRVVGDKPVTEVLTTGRVEISNQVQILMQEIIDRYDMGVKIYAIKLQDVNPPKIVQASFNDVNSAKQEQEKMINEAEEAYNKVIPEARGKAKKLISEAEGYAGAIINRAHGDADKFTAIVKEYKRAPSVTKKRIFIETMEELYQRFDDVTIIDNNVKGLLPVFGSQGVTNAK